MRLRWRLASAAAVALVFAIIFQFSAQSSQDSNGLSLGMAQSILAFFGVRSYEALCVANILLRKGAHFTIYFVLDCGLALTAVNRQKPLRGFLLCVITGAVLAAFDEGHQNFSTGRTPSLWDMLLDSCGVAAGSGATVSPPGIPGGKTGVEMAGA